MRYRPPADTLAASHRAADADAPDIGTLLQVTRGGQRNAVGAGARPAMVVIDFCQGSVHRRHRRNFPAQHLLRHQPRRQADPLGGRSRGQDDRRSVAGWRHRVVGVVFAIIGAEKQPWPYVPGAVSRQARLIAGALGRGLRADGQGEGRGAAGQARLLRRPRAESRLRLKLKASIRRSAARCRGEICAAPPA